MSAWAALETEQLEVASEQQLALLGPQGLLKQLVWRVGWVWPPEKVSLVPR